MTDRLRLGVNIDHIATLRNARAGAHPDPVRAARVVAEAGADSVTAHLREDRRHITDDDIRRIRAEVSLPLNLEMAAAAEMAGIAAAVRPPSVCIVPERREELTTEGGLDVAGNLAALKPLVASLTEAGIVVALFIDPVLHQVEAACDAGAPAIELHTGEYCSASRASHASELQRLEQAATRAAARGLECHAGHGLTVENVGPVAAIADIVELNIGHAIVGEAVFTGLAVAIRAMRAAMDGARARGGAVAVHS